MTDIIFALLAGLLSGLFASMGIGGGFVLILYLLLFGGSQQLEAQGLNLVFFIPVIILSVIIHLKNRLVDVRYALWTGIAGIPAAIGGYFLAGALPEDILQKCFAVFLFAAGLRELFSRPEGLE